LLNFFHIAQKEIATSRLKTTKFFVDLSKGLEQRLHDFTDSLIKEMKNSLLTHANPGRFALLCIRLGKIKKVFILTTQTFYKNLYFFIFFKEAFF
jgi:hypothetical protein